MTLHDLPEQWFNGHHSIQYVDGTTESVSPPTFLEIRAEGLVVKPGNGGSQGSRFIPWVQIRELVRG